MLHRKISYNSNLRDKFVVIECKLAISEEWQNLEASGVTIWKRCERHEKTINANAAVGHVSALSRFLALSFSFSLSSS